LLHGLGLFGIVVAVILVGAFLDDPNGTLENLWNLFWSAVKWIIVLIFGIVILVAITNH